MKKVVLSLGVLVGILTLVGMVQLGLLPNSNEHAGGGDKVSALDESYYQKLREGCNKQPLKDFENCCLDSVRAMEVVGGFLIKGDKYVEKDCPKGYERMALRCPGSYVWCQTDPDNGMANKTTPPVPRNVIKVTPPDSRRDVICTDDAKMCPDGSYVGRTSPNCEFAPCPGKSLNPDFVPTKDTSIQLPKNVISKEECLSAGGKVWNTLGQTDYKGELIGKIEGLNCPCVCLVEEK